MTEVTGDPKATVSSRGNRTDVHMSLQRPWRHEQRLHRFKPHGSQLRDWGSGCSSHSQSRSYLQLIKEKLVFSSEFHWVYY